MMMKLNQHLKQFQQKLNIVTFMMGSSITVVLLHHLKLGVPNCTFCIVISVIYIFFY